MSADRAELGGDAAHEQASAAEWGLRPRDVYRLGVSFYREKEGKAIHLSYEDKLKLVAYTQQASHGPFDEKTAPPLGVLDVIGRDRRAAWLALGQMSRIQAMIAFIRMLDTLCPLFRPYVEAFKNNNRHEPEQKQTEKTDHIDEIQKKAESEMALLQKQKSAEEEQIRRIKDALNEQTYDQFLEYAQQQYPGNPDQQAVLVRQLQDQHYHQYIQQLALNKQEAAEQRLNKGTSTDIPRSDAVVQVNSAPIENLSSHISVVKEKNESVDDSSPEHVDDSQSEDGDGFPTIASASMWTRSGKTAQFKQTVRSAAGGGGMLQVGHGETVTIRVPTHAEGRCLFWEFATDNFDIGFGVYFEWSKSPTSQVTVHVAESDDEGDLDAENFDDDDEELIQRCSDDLENGSPTNRSSGSSLKAPVSIIIPIYRRDSHLEVYAGSHAYPGEGVYLLKFDNTFSLWRSKTLYYRVYYTR